MKFKTFKTRLNTLQCNLAQKNREAHVRLRVMETHHLSRLTNMTLYNTLSLNDMYYDYIRGYTVGMEDAINELEKYKQSVIKSRKE